jgi:hypothetical protein
MRPMKAQTLDGTRRLGNKHHGNACLACMILSRLIVLQVTNTIKYFLYRDLSLISIDYSLLILCKILENGQGRDIWD